MNPKPNTRSIIVVVSAVLVLLAAAGLGLGGLPVFVVIGVASLPWIALGAHRLGATTAVVATALVFSLVFFLVLYLTAATALPMLGTTVALATGIGLAGIMLCARNPAVLRVPSRLALAVWLPSTLGGVVWAVTMLLARVIPGANQVSWTMFGDSANNVIMAHQLIYADGLVPDPQTNPVPLPSALLAVAMAAGRSGVAPADLARHDVTSFAFIWSVLIALACTMFGVAASTVARAGKAGPIVLALVSAGASLIPLSWFVTGYSLEFGFFNVHIALPIVLAAFVVYLGYPQRAIISLSLLLVAATLIFAVWSPLVLVVVGLGLIIVITRFSELLATRGIALLLFGAALLQLVVYVGVIVIPSLVQRGEALTFSGAVFNFYKWFYAAVAVALTVSAILAFPKLRSHVLRGALVVVLSFGVGLAALLYISRNNENIWAYYPTKFAWLGMIVELVLIVGFATVAVLRLFGRRVLRAVGLATVGGLTIAFLFVAPYNHFLYVATDPVPGVLKGHYLGPGNVVSDTVFELATPEQASILWQSDNPDENAINFWVLSLWADSFTDNDLRTAAYGIYDHDDPDELCRIMGLMGGDVRVITANPSLESVIDETCPTRQARVELVED